MHVHPPRPEEEIHLLVFHDVLLSQRLAILHMQIADVYGSPFLREQLADGSTNATCTTRYQSHFAFKPHSCLLHFKKSNKNPTNDTLP
jgi:hypothetical protein